MMVAEQMQTDLLMPSQQDTSTDIAPAGHGHALVNILHQCALSIWR